MDSIKETIYLYKRYWAEILFDVINAMIVVAFWVWFIVKLIKFFW